MLRTMSDIAQRGEAKRGRGALHEGKERSGGLPWAGSQLRGRGIDRDRSGCHCDGRWVELARLQERWKGLAGSEWLAGWLRPLCPAGSPCQLASPRFDRGECGLPKCANLPQHCNINLAV